MTPSQRRKSREIVPGQLAVWLDRVILATLFLFAFAAPISIAAAQFSWAMGILFWLLRLAVWPRQKLDRTPLDYPLLAFFILTGLSSFLSYEPFVSIGKLRGAMLFTIAFLFAQEVRAPRAFRALVVVLISAAAFSGLYTFGQFAIGRGVKVSGMSPNSPLKTTRFVTREKNDPSPIQSGDTIEEINGERISNPEELVAALDRSPADKPAQIKIYRLEWNPILRLPRDGLLPGVSAEERLGIGPWSRGRDRRATGFFNHWTTYSESLQLLASLGLGLLIALPRKRSQWTVLLLLALAIMCGALLLTVVRASWLAFLASALVMALIGLRWRAILIVGACALPLIVAGLFVLQQKRNVGFFDSKDDSIRWRQTVQREGLQLLKSNPRHLLVGVGMDSIKAHWREWKLFDNGRLPMGHMHSDYLQIALERGLPALIAWLALMALYARMLWRLQRQLSKESWIERGVVLGALGGLVGFMISGLVHYNWGDSEVVMIFYLIMGLSLVVNRVAEVAALPSDVRKASNLPGKVQ
ncbi:MAG: O-antigen ligase family protein [Acidobacteriota bacterium]